MTDNIMQAWRAEIEAEMTEARADLTKYMAALESAEAAAQRLREAHRAAAAMVGRITAAEPLGEPLARRWDDLRRELGSAVAVVGNARGGIDIARRRIAEWQRALDQVDIATRPEAQAEPAPVAVMGHRDLARRSGHRHAETGPAGSVGVPPAAQLAEVAEAVA